MSTGPAPPIAGPLLLACWGRRGAGVQYLLHLAQALRDRETRDLFVSCSRQSELSAETAALGLPTIPVSTYSGLAGAAVGTLRLPFLRRRLRAGLDRRRIATTLVCMPHPWGSATADVLRSGGRRLVTLVHDAVPHPGEDYPLPAWLLSREIGLSDGIVTLSAHVAALVAERYAYPPERIFQASLPSLIPVAGARVRAVEPPGRPLRLLFLGRILPYKGVDLLLDALGLLGEPARLQLTIAGAGGTAVLRERVARMNGVRLVERWLDREEMALLLEDADVLVAPYREASQSGVVPAALAAGLPVIATPVGGLREQVAHGRTGILAEAATAEALAGAIRLLLERPDLCRQYSEGALRLAGSCLGWREHAGRILEIVGRVEAMPRR